MGPRPGRAGRGAEDPVGVLIGQAESSVGGASLEEWRALGDLICESLGGGDLVRERAESCSRCSVTARRRREVRWRMGVSVERGKP